MSKKRVSYSLIAVLACVLMGGCGQGSVSVSKGGPEEGQQWVADLGGGVTMEFVPIAAGSFMMGLEDGGRNERPVHQVTISKPFWMAKTEVTQAQYQQMMGANPSQFKGSGNPVENVRWNDAMEFCRKLTAQERQAGRLPEGWMYTLPTEAQWEYACRAGTSGMYAGDLDAMAWYDKNSGGTTHPVGTKQPNGWGLHDMHGNVWEWCKDRYGEYYYAISPASDPEGPSSGSDYVWRGGSWSFDAFCCRSSIRDCGPPDNDVFWGFRPVLSDGKTPKKSREPSGPEAGDHKNDPTLKEAKQGDVEAQLVLGGRYVVGMSGFPQDYKEAMKWYRLAAEQGHVEGQYMVGAGYAAGEGVSQDYKEAVKWFRLAAEQGYAKAQYRMGLHYEEGAGVPQDDKEAVKWYRLAAEQGHGLSQCQLGRAYGLGQGVSEDLVQAYAWLNIASVQGVANAPVARAVVLRCMTPTQIKAGQQLSREYAAKYIKK